MTMIGMRNIVEDVEGKHEVESADSWIKGRSDENG
jgi:hypothetical protein